MNMDRIKNVIVYISIFAIGIFLGIIFMLKLDIDIGKVSGKSMENTFSDGDRILFHSKVEKLKRGDIVSVRGYLNGKEINLVKRIIGLPDERVTISAGKVYINSELLEEPYIKSSTDHETEYANFRFSDVKLKKDEYFLMGDNRNNSGDSRELGPVPGNNINGVAIIIWQPKKNR